MSATEIYFASDCKGSIKVGFSRCVSRRLKELQKGRWDNFNLLGSVPGLPREEKAIHRMLAEHRIDGEWYLDCPQVRILVETAITHGIGALDLQLPEYKPQQAHEIVEQARAQANALVDFYQKQTSSRMFAYLETAKVIGASEGWVRKFVGGSNEVTVNLVVGTNIFRAYEQIVLETRAPPVGTNEG